MKKTTQLLTLVLILLPSISQAQSLGLWASIDWSVYQRYQRPSTHDFAQIAGQKNSAGQVLNVLPSIRLGMMLNTWKRFDLTIEGGICYAPFSQDIDRYKGIGALSFPVLMSLQIHGDYDDWLITIGGGVQFSRIEYAMNPKDFEGINNPYFMTYVGEISYGTLNKYYVFAGLSIFGRLGFGSSQAHTLDIGVRVNLGLPFAH